MTNLTREIVKDLLPLYAAGEASAETRAAVEEWLRSDPELARLVDALRGDGSAPAKAAVAPGADQAALAATKALLRRRTWLLALALFFSGLPLSFVAGSDGIRFLMLRDAPGAALACVVVAVALWIALGAVARRLRVSGL